MNRLATAAGLATLAAAAGAGGYVGLVTGRLTVDLGVGRRTRPLGPLSVDVDARPDVVYDVAVAPYAERRPQTLRDKVEILERSEQMVLAAHRTPVGGGLVAVTVETVTFDPPRRVGFRLVRGPVPHVVETFTFEPTDGGTRLRYDGELGTDCGALGDLWGRVVAGTWVATVQSSLDEIRNEAERLARRQRAEE